MTRHGIDSSYDGFLQVLREKRRYKLNLSESYYCITASIYWGSSINMHKPHKVQRSILVCFKLNFATFRSLQTETLREGSRTHSARSIIYPKVFGDLQLARATKLYPDDDCNLWMAMARSKSKHRIDK